MKKILSIAGSDCSGGAGIQADLKTFSAHGLFGMTAIASVVAENTVQVLAYQDVRPDILKLQIDAVFADIPPDAVKIGMLSSSGGMVAVAGRLRRWAPRNVVVDPVMYAKNGCALMDSGSIDTLLSEIVPLADVVTPNIPEAERMTGRAINSVSDMEAAARCIHRMGCRAVLVKGGHSTGDATDILFDGRALHRFSAARIHTKNTHGTGCTYSAAIASNLALGMSLQQAVERGKRYVTTAIAHALDLGRGSGPTHHFYDLYRYGLQGGGSAWGHGTQEGGVSHEA